MLYSIILFATAARFLAVGTAIRKGRTDLINDYHQSRVNESERPAYGRAFAKGMFSISGTLFLSGAIALFGEERLFFAASLIVLFAGLAVSLIVIVRVQKKYNGGIF